MMEDFWELFNGQKPLTVQLGPNYGHENDSS